MENMDDTQHLPEEPLFSTWDADAKAIILVDLDAFFASVEQMDHPEWKGKPVIVGGSPEHRGVVSTASYEARAFGVHSAMPSATAKKLCPEAIWVSGNYHRYGEVSARVMEVLYRYTPFVQQVSIDEAFADITPSQAFPDHPAAVAAAIQEDICALGVTCSVGLATNKSLAKIASEMDKPRGLTVVYPGTELAFVDHLPVRALSGIGPATEQRLRKAGYLTLGSLARLSRERLVQLMGKSGTMVYESLHGQEPVEYWETAPKSVSHDVTFPEDIRAYPEAEKEMLAILGEVCRRLRLTPYAGKVLGVRLKYDLCNAKSAQTTLDVPSRNEYDLKEPACALLQSIWADGQPVRLISVSLSGLTEPADVQSDLFSGLNATKDTSRLVEVEDSINTKFGKGAVEPGRKRYSQAGTMYKRTDE